MRRAHKLTLLAWWSATLVTLTLAATAEPYLSLRANPPIMLSGAVVTLTAELHGDEREDWYCPEVVWTMPDSTVARHEADCPPFEDREDYPRRWTRRLRLPEGVYTFEVELRKAGKRLALRSVTVEVK